MKTYGIEPIDEYFTIISVDKSPNSIIVYQTAVNKLFEFLNVKTFDDVKKITSANLRSHQANMKKNGLSHVSINTNMRPIRTLFNWLVENEYLVKSPMEKVKALKEDKKVTVFLSEEEGRKMIMACKKDSDRLILALMISVGLRREELCKLKTSSYDGTHILIEGKGSKERKLILTPEVRELLNKYLEYRNKKYGNSTDALIVSNYGRHFTGDAIYKKIKSIVESAGLSEERIEAIHPHTTRHTFCTNMLEITSLPQVQAMMGHERPETTMRYSHVRNTAIDNSMLKQKSIL
jgi:integrase/recombinase XerD